jgi:hypothetical protein
MQHAIYNITLSLAGPAGLRNGMYGMTPGEERTFSFTFPEEYNVELWAGSEAQATMKVQELFRWAGGCCGDWCGWLVWVAGVGC